MSLYERVVRGPCQPRQTSLRESKGTPPFKALRKGRQKLSPQERAICMKQKAVWHNRLKRNKRTGEMMHLATPAVWKAEVNGKTWYVTNTHRAYNVTPTLNGTIGRYHRFIKSTA